MQEDPKQREITDKILKATEEMYGFIPVTNKVLSTRPDIFVPSAEFSKCVLENENGAIERKFRYLLAISAAAATGGEHCLKVQIQHAKDVGATKDEILESIMIGSFMSMTRSQSYALRAFADAYDIKY
ncbi:MAG: carboxymuconolactone decarboxylase family protein [Candidatus Methanomethylophilaceae archaeon]|jgi:alkylhydroperoxidase/carboxymuconolactone decarboxylase family protein YurZ|nr:carboxymuconolactone decarboxylase family protein [Candidatus Methanomethylophilaceae archaeon]MBO7352244.1 carboxymuconolactone decarboxylase family protein [Candidatus Methanomethylophilaceae archaeon]MBP5685125.1 carboxymuconolactone decarboxylase family protein [Candidatus Methanomethylophilaceae archaeon]MBP5734802.1 carboxymuconolactone decarboxylase family protein [Candidatus Methanomethylophilaceae archaeon]